MTENIRQELYIRGKNGIYWMRFRYKGQRVHQSTKTSNKAGALAMLEFKKSQLMGESLVNTFHAQDIIINDIQLRAGRKHIPTGRGLYIRGKTYWMRFRYKGKRIHQSTETSEKATAFTVLMKKKYDLLISHKGTAPTPKENTNDIQFEDAAIITFYHHFSEQRSASANAYKLLVLCDLIGDKYVSQINETTFGYIEIALKERDCGPNTINKYFSTINTVIEIVRKKFNAPCHPVLKVHLAIKRKNIRYISYSEEKEILAYLEHPLRSAHSRAGWTCCDLVEIYRVGVTTGMRRGELFSFRVEQVHGQTIHLGPEQHKTGDSQGNKTIIIPMIAKSIIEARIERLKLKCVFH